MEWSGGMVWEKGQGEEAGSEGEVREWGGRGEGGEVE